MEAEVDLDLPKMSSFARKAKIEMNDAMHGLENATESTNYIKKRALKVSFCPEVRFCFLYRVEILIFFFSLNYFCFADLSISVKILLA